MQACWCPHAHGPGTVRRRPQALAGLLRGAVQYDGFMATWRAAGADGGATLRRSDGFAELARGFEFLSAQHSWASVLMARWPPAPRRGAAPRQARHEPHAPPPRRRCGWRLRRSAAPRPTLTGRR